MLGASPALRLGALWPAGWRACSLSPVWAKPRADSSHRKAKAGDGDTSATCSKPFRVDDPVSKEQSQPEIVAAAVPSICLKNIFPCWF